MWCPDKDKGQGTKDESNYELRVTNYEYEIPRMLPAYAPQLEICEISYS